MIRRTGIAISLVAVGGAWSARAQTLVTVEWSIEQKQDLPAWSFHASSSTGAVTIQLNESGFGESAPITPTLEQHVELKPPFDQLCHLGSVKNPPVKISVARQPEGGGRYWVSVERQGDPPSRGFTCSGPMGKIFPSSGLALTLNGVDSPFMLTELQPGVTKSHDLAKSTPSSPAMTMVKNELRLTVSPCAPKPGSSGDGSIQLLATPPVGQDPWPVTEIHQPIKRMQPRAGGAGDEVVVGATGSIFPDSDEARDPDHKIVRYRAPKTHASWSSEQPAGGVCFYLDSVELRLPEIEVVYPQEFWDARDQKCWYGAVRWHEEQHVSGLGRIQRQLQADVQELLRSPSVPSPGKPAFAHDEAEMNRIETDFSNRFAALLEKAKNDIAASGNDLDDLNAYAIENAFCTLPAQQIKEWLQ